MNKWIPLTSDRRYDFRVKRHASEESDLFRIMLQLMKENVLVPKPLVG